jgi:hypothetical protein
MEDYYCEQDTPGASCSKKPKDHPEPGMYEAVFHVCRCCAGPDIVQVVRTAEGTWVLSDASLTMWDDFNGHLIGPRVSHAPTTSPAHLGAA